MGAPAILKIEIIADAAKAVAGLGKVDDAAKKTGDHVEKSGSKFGAFAKTAAKLAGAAALGGLVAVFKTGVDEQSDFLAGQAQLANGIKTTGNAANVSVSGLENLASSIQNYSGQTDDSIVASEKLLLTFTNVRNVAGKNNDIFTQTTKLTADMAAKMGGDASAYAVKLGKALNDPVKGLSALTKVGVSFTDAQKKSIKAMQESGNTLGAQKVILGELKKEFGGSAKAAGETLPGQLAKAKRSFEDVSQSLVASLMPVLTLLANFLTKNVLPAFKVLVDWMTSHKSAVVAFAAAITAVYAAMKIGQATAAVGAAGGIVKWIKATNLAKAATTAWAGVQAVMNGIMAAFPVIAIVLGILALIAVIIIAYKKSATFRAIVQAAFAAVVIAAKALWKALVAAFRAIQTAMRILFAVVRAVFSGIVSAVRLYGRLLFLVFVKPWQLAFRAVVAVVRALQGWIGGAFHAIVSAVRSALSTVAHAIAAPFRAAWDWIRDHVVAPMRAMFEGLAGAIGAAMHGVESAITAPFRAAWNWISSNVIGPLKSVWNGIANAINSIHFSVKIPSWVPGVGGNGFTFDPPNVPTLARGGVVDRATLAVIGEGRGREIVAPEALLRSIVGDASPTVINVNGALDPDAVARQIETLLRRRARRTGGVRLTGAPVAT